MTVTCRRCGDSWDRDPALAVACPKCRAMAGMGCQRPSGHGCAVHVERDALAVELGHLRPCRSGLRAEHLLPADAEGQGALAL